MTEEKTSRVAMLWPEDLKERVRQRAGKRGLTAFTIEAVKAKLNGRDQADTQDDEDQRPDDEEQGSPEPEPESGPEPEPPEPEPDLPAVGDPGTIRSEERKVGNLLDRVRGKAMEKGVDLSGVDLKPASTIELPADPPAELEPDAQTPEAIPTSDVCPKCGSELIGGECWECM